MPEGSSPLTFRDSIRHLLPTAAAVSLFVPLWSDDKLEVAACVLCVRTARVRHYHSFD